MTSNDEREDIMKKMTGILMALALGGCFATTGEDGRVVGGEATFTMSLPAVLPPLIVVEPGVSVVRDLDDEVFYVDGYYWARRDRGWIRAQDHRGTWVRVEERRVPGTLVKSPPGRYRQFRGQEGRGDQDHGRRGPEGEHR
jgi:hypothetical protein